MPKNISFIIFKILELKLLTEVDLMITGSKFPWFLNGINVVGILLFNHSSIKILNPCPTKDILQFGQQNPPFSVKKNNAVIHFFIKMWQDFCNFSL